MNTTTLNMTTLDGGNVIIKKGGGGTPTPPSGGSFEYLDITNVTGMGGQLKMLLVQMSYMCKVPEAVIIQNPTTEGILTITKGITPATAWGVLIGKFDSGTEEYRLALDAVSAISINFSETVYTQGQVMTIGDVFAAYGLQADIDAIPRLTKEQFYSLD